MVRNLYVILAELAVGTHDAEQAESLISDILVEVFDTITGEPAIVSALPAALPPDWVYPTDFVDKPTPDRIALAYLWHLVGITF